MAGAYSVSSVFSPAVDRFFQTISGFERYNAPGCDRNLLPSLGIATHAFRFQSDAEHTEFGQLDDTIVKQSVAYFINDFIDYQLGFNTGECGCFSYGFS